MTVVVTFENVTPVARYDALAWTEARIEEASTATGTYAEIETIDLATLPGGLDADPSDPATRNFTTELGTADGLWYQIIFVDADGDESAPTDPIQNVSSGTAYATVDELARILKLDRGAGPTAAQTVSLARVLSAAAGEINSEIDLASDADPLAGWQLALATEVNLERAAELWKEQEVQFGILVGGGIDAGATYISRNTWERYANKLAPLKGQWGFA
jgi:hypothetical protein